MAKGVYNPKAFIPHAASLHQAFAHCAIFPTAASRRSLGRVSVPVWPVTLSGRLPVIALVGHYPTNKLIGRESTLDQKIFPPRTMRHADISSIRPSFPGLSQSQGQVTHVLLTRSPLIRDTSTASSFDLHVLSTPPAFVLSQDQTLQKRKSKTRPNQRKQKKFHNDQPNKHLASITRHAVEFSKNMHPRAPESARFCGCEQLAQLTRSATPSSNW